MLVDNSYCDICGVTSLSVLIYRLYVTKYTYACQRCAKTSIDEIFAGFTLHQETYKNREGDGVIISLNFIDAFYN
jgi:hypothetical protein